MMLQQMQSSLESFRLKEWEMPISQINGIHLDLASMYAQMPFRTTKDYENYLARLHAVPAALDQTIVVMRLGMRDHMMQPRYLLEKVPAEAEQVADAAPEKSPFAEPLGKFPETVSQQDRERLRTAIVTAIHTEVEPAYARFATFVKTQYAPAGRAEPGVWALPDGKALYLHEIRVHTQTSGDTRSDICDGYAPSPADRTTDAGAREEPGLFGSAELPQTYTRRPRTVCDVG